VWSSEARRLATVAAATVATAAAAATASAQGAVRGELALVQRPGADAADLRDAVVWLEPRGHAPPAARVPPEEGTILMREREFRPHVLAVRAGGSVAFPNDDPFSHNVFSNAEGGPFDLGLYRRGVTRAAAFPRAGVYPVYCNIHSKMVSFVVALPPALVASVDEAGRFAFDAVPAGAYVLHAWHERGAAELTRELAVPAEGAAGVQLTLDARAYVGAPHLNKYGRPYALMRADRY
jgi:hypothetical protein